LHAPSRRPPLAIALSLATALVLGGSLSYSLAAPAVSTADVSVKRAQAAQASEELARMRGRLAGGLAAYERVSARLSRTRREIADNEKRLRVLKRRLGSAQNGLGVRADYIYRTRGTGMLDVLLSAATLDEFVERLDVLTSIASRDAAVVAQVKRARAEQTRLRGMLREREAMLANLQEKAQAERKRLQAEVDSQQAHLGSLDADVAQLVRDADRASAPVSPSTPLQPASGSGKCLVRSGRRSPSPRQPSRSDPVATPSWRASRRTTPPRA
jgi:peptidoglycan hydrolase CwlO-like protein